MRFEIKYRFLWAMLLILPGLNNPLNAQCDPADYTLTYSNDASCLNNGDNVVSTYERIHFNIADQSGPYSVVWQDNGTQIGLSASYPLLKSFNYYFTTAGTHTITLKITRSGCSLITKTLVINVVQRSCPLVQASFPTGPSVCWSTRDSMSVSLSLESGSGTILSSSWNFSDGSAWSDPGDQFYFTPIQPGSVTGIGYATIKLPDNSTCVSPIHRNGNCDVLVSMQDYSDPRFEVQGSLLAGEPLDIIFKGTDLSGPGVPFEYELFVNGVSQVVTTNLAYNQLIKTIPSPAAGTYTIKLVGVPSGKCTDIISMNVIVNPTDPVDPGTCSGCSTFVPLPGSKYWVSAWVKENHAAQVKTYVNSSVEIEFFAAGGASTVASFTPVGDIIEGWQRIAGEFTVPAGTIDMKINLVNSQSTAVDNYFDDVRIHTFNGSMKSYVYDPVTFWLTAELDDNNYATFYEYDKEGQLIRIKKETARGVMTIQESRSGNVKKPLE